MSNASMKILRKLPPVPRPATKPQIHQNLYGEGIWIHEAKPRIPSHMELHEKQAAARTRQTGKAEKKHDMIKRLASEGLSDAEIGYRTGVQARKRETDPQQAETRGRRYPAEEERTEK